MACLRSFSRRSLYSKLSSSSLLISHIKDDTKSSSSLIRRFHNQSFLQKRNQVSFVPGLVSCRYMSSNHFSETTTGIVSFSDGCVEYIVNGIHELTGTNWWISIGLTAFLVNGLMAPPVFREFDRYCLEEQKILHDIDKRVEESGVDPKEVAKYEEMKIELMLSYSTRKTCSLNLWFLDLLIHASFISGISTMAKKIPAFENGGIFWYTDLSTPESFYILPMLTGCAYWLTTMILYSEKNLKSSMKCLPWFVIPLIVLQAAYGLEPAVYFYMIPSRICTSTMTLMLRKNQIAKFLE